MRSRTVTYLAYDRLDDEWQLGIKVVEEEMTDRDEGTEEINPEYLPLIQASHDLRLAVLRQMPRLLDELKPKGEELLAAVDAAQKLAESCVEGIVQRTCPLLR